MKKVSIIIIFLITLSPHSTWAQLNNKQHIIQTMDYVYNFDFVEVDSIINKIDSSSQYSIYNFLKSQYYRWYFLPMHEKSGSILNNYYRYINFKINPESTIDSLIMLNNKLLKAEYYYNNDEHYNAFTEAFSLYGLIESKLALSSGELTPDWLLMVSLYHYYFDFYKKKNKLLAGMMWMLKNGDKKKGIEGLQKLAASNEIGKTEALIYLSHIYLRLEDQADSAYKYSSILHKRYPNNQKFYELVIESSLSSNLDTDSILPLIVKLKHNENTYFRKYGIAYDALVKSKKGIYKSEDILLIAIKNIEELGGGRHLKSILYKALYDNTQGKKRDEFEKLTEQNRRYFYSLTQTI